MGIGLDRSWVTFVLTVVGMACCDPAQAQDRRYDNKAFLADEVRREMAQGSKVLHLNQDRCIKLLEQPPNDVWPENPPWNPGTPSPYSPYLTPTENWCLAQGRDATSPADELPHILPGGGFVTPLGNGNYRLTR